MSRGRKSMLLLLGAMLAGGCSNTLETGYKPRKLGTSGVERRSYYASPYSPEATAAEQKRQEQLNNTGVRQGY